MKRLLLLITSALFNFYCVAQPIMTAGNYNPSIGEAFNYNVWDSATFIPGSPGANVTWDFSTATSSANVISVWEDPAATIYGTSFTTSNLGADHDGNYEYAIGNTSFFARTGVANPAVTFSYFDEQKELIYPFTYNSHFVDSFACDFEISGYQFERRGTVTANADGYGTVILPWGTITDVLRVHYTEAYTDVSVIGTTNYASDNYAWFKPGVHYPVCNLASAGIIGGQITVGGAYLNADMVGISENNPEKIAFSLFPNPAANKLFIKYSLKESSPVDISVTNLAGQVVSLVTNESSAGNQTEVINVSEFPNGMYFVNIKSDNIVYTKKLVVNN